MNRPQWKLFISLIFVFTIVSFTFQGTLSAAVISKVNGRKITINLQKSKAKKGQVFYVYNRKGKRKGKAKIKKVSGRMAEALLYKKSKAKVGWKLKRKRYRKSRRSSRRKYKSKRAAADKKMAKGYYGAIAGYNVDSMSVKFDDASSTSMAGGAFSFKGLLDYKLFSIVWLRAMAGLEQFNVSSSTPQTGCGDTAAAEKCNVTISYLSLDLWGRLLFSSGTFRPWVGGGYDLLMPMSKSSTSVKSISTTGVFVGGFGFDILAGKSMMIPLQVEYGIFPASSKVKASYFGARGGIAWSF